MSLRTNNAPWEKGSKMGMSRYTLSRLKDEIEAMFPVLKNADCRSVRKKREMRASVRVRDLKGEDAKDGGMLELPLLWTILGLLKT